MAGKYLTTAQAAEYLGVSTRTMRRWRNRNIGPAYVRYSDRTCRYPLGSLERFRADHAAR